MRRTGVIGLALGLLCGAWAQEELRREDRTGRLRAGDMAADFTLNVMHSQTAVTLSGFRSRRPVALIFGSYT